MGFDGGWGFGVNFLQLLFVGFSILFWIALLAVLVLLVRFLLIGTKAAQVYLRRHEPPQQQQQPAGAPQPGGAPQPAPAPGAAPTVPPMDRPTPPTASEPAPPASAVADRTAVLPTASDATTERLSAAPPDSGTAAPRRGARPAKKTE